MAKLFEYPPVSCPIHQGDMCPNCEGHNLVTPARAEEILRENSGQTSYPKGSDPELIRLIEEEEEIERRLREKK